jgi:ribonuclease J
MNNKNQISFMPIGGVGDVTKNMYIYEYDNQILIVDCGVGFVDETMIGVDLLLPDISYLKTPGKKIIGMVLSHGHEDHIGALPFILPQLPSFPIYGSPLTAAFSNGKLKEFNVNTRVKTVSFEGGDISMGPFTVSLVRIAHSVPDAANLFIRTPAGNFFHASDYKMDFTPYDDKKVDFAKIARLSAEGVTCLMSDSLNSEEDGYTPSEKLLAQNIEKEMRLCKGKFILTTYSSNISRLNQTIYASIQTGRKICFLGRSLLSAVDIADSLEYLKLPKGMEIRPDQIKNFRDSQLTIIAAGSQGQENSALTRIANDEFREVKIKSGDVVVFSADPIPGNELSINQVIDTLAKRGAKVLYSAISKDFHVSGHGAAMDIMLMMSLVKPKNVLPIGGTYRQMVAFKSLARLQGFEDRQIIFAENGQEILFEGERALFGKKVPIKNVYLDEVSGEAVDQFVLRDRQKIVQDGVVIVMLEIDSSTGQPLEDVNIIVKGFTFTDKQLNRRLNNEIKQFLVNRKGTVTDWIFIRKNIARITESFMNKSLRKQPLVVPVVVEV